MLQRFNIFNLNKPIQTTIKNQFLCDFFYKKKIKNRTINFLKNFKKEKMKSYFFKFTKSFCHKSQSKKEVKLKKDKIFFNGLNKRNFFRKFFNITLFKGNIFNSLRKNLIKLVDDKNLNNIHILKKLTLKMNVKKIDKKIFRNQKNKKLKKKISALTRVLTISKSFFFKKTFNGLPSIPFQNKQIHKFLFFYCNLKENEALFLDRFKKSSFNFRQLNLFFFNFLYSWVKNQHLNNSNMWILNKYCFFFQPFFYFFKTYLKFQKVRKNIKFQKKSGHNNFPILKNKKLFVQNKKLKTRLGYNVFPFNFKLKNSLIDIYSKFNNNNFGIKFLSFLIRDFYLNSSRFFSKKIRFNFKFKVYENRSKKTNIFFLTYYFEKCKPNYFFKLNIIQSRKKYSFYPIFKKMSFFEI